MQNVTKVTFDGPTGEIALVHESGELVPQCQGNLEEADNLAQKLGARLEVRRWMCDQNCGNRAKFYAIDRHPDGWGGHYCLDCANALGFQIVDRL